MTIMMMMRMLVTLTRASASNMESICNPRQNHGPE